LLRAVRLRNIEVLRDVLTTVELLVELLSLHRC
jgi:hypothetical protein